MRDSDRLAQFVASCRPSELFRAQALNDFSVFSVSATASLFAGTTREPVRRASEWASRRGYFKSAKKNAATSFRMSARSHCRK